MDAMLYALPFLMKGFSITLWVSALVVVFSLAAGLVLGVALVYGPRPLQWIVRLFSDCIRGIPILVLIFVVYYGFPPLGISINSFWAGVVALTLFKAAQVIEYVRGAISSIPRGQMEAGKAIGLTFVQRLQSVIFPQAVRRFLPPWINGVTDAVKGSALISLLGVVDLMQSINEVIGRTYEAMPLYLLGAFIYFAINYSLSLTSRFVERRYAYIRD
ncbi:amino acid ABC transporter permease [Aquamicrobium defluvii]|uniref:Amino acid ABC transporter membrane protein 2 (PAAT family) n=1 Tax=Aquamicrobium defluvii TaxID=69279 RepID=A0A011ULJ7_9HYPH|nr:amino acid ABC transporter permease [Aquamicrobium defluvii]EXL06778.1 glutamine ABC transporter permease [Aquamicrobium defluvii]EZQ15785.1 glutamine ABC transporter permease [Halopseudomonas bauzanensis]TDR35912.1 amino acid ABC transporter membrane protein 2 (PAAT family) [Aquamicrobium defluvii]